MSAVNYGRLLAGDPRHGTTNGYSNLGCRCDRCRAANRAYTAALRARDRAAVPTP